MLQTKVVEKIFLRREISSKASEDKCDTIGPPHPVSNLRPIHFHIPKYEAPIEKRLRLKREEIQIWNQYFWIEHNTRFIKAITSTLLLAFPTVPINFGGWGGQMGQFYKQLPNSIKYERNLDAFQERKEFVAANQLAISDAPLSADKMSLFYKSFLDKNWKAHLDYNLQWYKNNAQLVALHLRVKFFWLWQHWKLK